MLAVLFVVAVLVGLNALSYVQQETIPDSESQPNRSTYNNGATGTRALFELLKANGRNVVRWREAPDAAFEQYDPEKLDTFVIIGSVRREIAEDEAQHVLAWVSAGGQLVVIDRDPHPNLLATTSPWEVAVEEARNNLSASERGYLIFSVDPANQSQMTARISAVKPSQPTQFNVQVNAVQPSKFSTSVRLTRVPQPEETLDEQVTEEGEEGAAEPLQSLGPVVHLTDPDRTLLADFPFGAGRIVLLTDPYVVANGGIELADNAQAALNVLGSRSGPIAFDEYHQGFGNDRNRLLSYFSGTPVIPIFLQIFALTALVIFSRGRRFGRPLPAPGEDRLSKLEYVAAMAQLQRRTRAYDLAVENIYTDFRRRASRSFGVDSFHVSKEELSRLIGHRLGRDPGKVRELIEGCEDVIYGDRASKSQVLALVRKIRELEDALGLERGSK